MPISISVVIPLYNKRPHIVNTLTSVLSQRVLPFEIIVIDDGSTDGSADVVIPYENRGVRVIKQKNSGVSAARNRGVSASTGGWIAFLDADDLWLPNHLECLTRVIEAYPNVGLVSTQHEILDSGVRFRTRSTYRSGVVCLVDDFYTRLANGLSLVNSSTACVRREAIEAIGGFPSNIHVGEDIILWTKLFEKFGMAHIAETSAVYRRDAVNRSTSIAAVKPSSLAFLGELLGQEKICKEKRKSIATLFDSIALFTAAGKKLQGDSVTVRHIQIECMQSKRIVVWLAISFILVIPISFLKAARNWRRGLADRG